LVQIAETVKNSRYVQESVAGVAYGLGLLLVLANPGVFISWIIKMPADCFAPRLVTENAPGSGSLSRLGRHEIPVAMPAYEDYSPCGHHIDRLI
jgi:hypothetical protein